LKVNRDQQSWHLKWLVIWCVIAVLFVVPSILFRHYLRMQQVWPIHAVDVTGDYQQLGKARIEKLVMPYVMHGYFNVDTHAIETTLLAFPSVQSVDTSLYGRTLVVHLTKRVPIARWPNGELYSQEHVFYKPLVKIDETQVPLINAPIASAKQSIQQLHQFDTLLAPDKLWILTLQKESAHLWQLQTQQGFWIVVRDRDVKTKLASFVKAYPELMQQAKGQTLEYVDLRYNNGFAAKWQ